MAAAETRAETIQEDRADAQDPGASRRERVRRARAASLADSNVFCVKGSANAAGFRPTNWSFDLIEPAPPARLQPAPEPAPEPPPLEALATPEPPPAPPVPEPVLEPETVAAIAEPVPEAEPVLAQPEPAPEPEPILAQPAPEPVPVVSEFAPEITPVEDAPMPEPAPPEVELATPEPEPEPEPEAAFDPEPEAHFEPEAEATNGAIVEHDGQQVPQIPLTKEVLVDTLTEVVETVVERVVERVISSREESPREAYRPTYRVYGSRPQELQAHDPLMLPPPVITVPTNEELAQGEEEEATAEAPVRRGRRVDVALFLIALAMCSVTGYFAYSLWGRGF